MIKKIAIDGINRENVFHTATHDNITTLPFSTFVEPLLYQLSKLILKLDEGKYDESDLWYTTEKIAQIFFAALMKMRDRGLIDECGRIGARWIFHNPLFIHAFIEYGFLEQLFDFKSARRFDYILLPIIESVKNRSNEMIHNQIERLIDFVIQFWLVQKQVYRRISFELRDLYVACIDALDKTKKFDTALKFANLMTSGEKDMHYSSDLTEGVKVLTSNLEFGDYTTNLKNFHQYIKFLGVHATSVKADLVRDTTHIPSKRDGQLLKPIEPEEHDIEIAKMILSLWPETKEE